MLCEKASGSDEHKSDRSEQGGVDTPIPRPRWWVALMPRRSAPRAELRGLPPLETLDSWAFLTRSNAARESPRKLDGPRSTIN